MSLLELFLLALALSIDAFIVYFSYGLIFEKDKVKNSLLLALFTGGFQGLMPVLGYYLTSLVKTIIEPYAKWIVLIIFLYLGFKFILESFKPKEKPLCISISCLFLIGIATSIDAFSAGITIALCATAILIPALLIGLITFINSILGFLFGTKLKHLSTIVLEVFAGLILIVLGIKAII